VQPGDAMLAIFPMRDDLDRDRACRDALTAAERALLDLDDLNLVRQRVDKPELKAGLGLHHGAVMYGNIGAPTRLDFTVIGPAVNLVTRIESLCPQLDRALLTSGPFASPCGSRLKSLGHHALKGIVSLQMQVDNAGKVHHIQVQSTLKDPLVAACVVKSANFEISPPAATGTNCSRSFSSGSVISIVATWGL